MTTPAPDRTFWIGIGTLNAGLLTIAVVLEVFTLRNSDATVNLYAVLALVALVALDLWVYRTTRAAPSADE